MEKEGRENEKDEAFKTLEYLSLVYKVCRELESHLGRFGNNDGSKVLAEFIIELGRYCSSVDEFSSELKELEAGFPDSLVHTLLTIIHAILPPPEKKKKAPNRDDDPPRRQSNDPELYKVYKGRVSKVMDSCCFVQLNEFGGKDKEGMVHVSDISSRRVANAMDDVDEGQEVFVKVTGVSGSGKKMSLSMRDVDQNSGRDLLPVKKSLMKAPVTRIVEEDDDVRSGRRLKRMSSHEIQEANQLIASGVMSVHEYPMYDDEEGDVIDGGQGELEIEMNEDKPAFLRGKTCILWTCHL